MNKKSDKYLQNVSFSSLSFAEVSEIKIGHDISDLVTSKSIIKQKSDIFLGNLIILVIISRPQMFVQERLGSLSIQ